MQIGNLDSPDEAFVRLASGLHKALAIFLAHHATGGDYGRSFANDNDPEEGRQMVAADDRMTLAEVMYDLRLKRKQIVALRRLWGFPRPWNDGALLIFSRKEVAEWAALQPNHKNFAAVLRLRRRDSLESCPHIFSET